MPKPFFRLRFVEKDKIPYKTNLDPRLKESRDEAIRIYDKIFESKVPAFALISEADIHVPKKIGPISGLVPLLDIDLKHNLLPFRKRKMTLVKDLFFEMLHVKFFELLSNKDKLLLVRGDDIISGSDDLSAASEKMSEEGLDIELYDFLIAHSEVFATFLTVQANLMSPYEARIRLKIIHDASIPSLVSAYNRKLKTVKHNSSFFKLPRELRKDLSNFQ